jgi:hypothetical protein
MDPAEHIFPWDINCCKDCGISLYAGGNFLVHLTQIRNSRSGKEQATVIPHLSILQEQACSTMGPHIHFLIPSALGKGRVVL